MKTRLLNAALLSSLLLGSGLVAQEKNIYLGVSSGYSHINIDQSNKDAISLGNTQEEDGYNLELKAGYKFTETIQLAINYQSLLLDDARENNTYLELDYLYPSAATYTPFIGVNAGYSELKYSKEPMNTRDNDFISGSLLLGVRAGVLYPLTDNIDLSAEYMLNFTDHVTHLVSASTESELHHNFSHNLNLGLRIYF